MNGAALRTVFAVCSIVVCFLFLQTSEASQSYTTVASNIDLAGVARDGDIVSYDPGQNRYHLSEEREDELMYGVVVLDPVLLLSNGVSVEDATGTPVVRFGEAVVNVSTLGGEIRAGDLITSSAVVGFGQRVDSDEAEFVLGFALEDMQTLEATVSVDDRTVELGRVPVALRIGPHVSKEGAALISGGMLTRGENGELLVGQNEEGQGFDFFKMFRYFLAAIVAILTVIVATRRFGDTFSQSVISVGRNPLARAQIRSMVIWNSILIVLISCVGFGISALIVFAP